MVANLPSSRIIERGYKEKDHEYKKRVLKTLCRKKEETKESWDDAMDDMEKRRMRWEENKRKSKENKKSEDNKMSEEDKSP